MQKTFSGRLRCKRGTSVLIRRHQGVWRGTQFNRRSGERRGRAESGVDSGAAPESAGQSADHRTGEQSSRGHHAEYHGAEIGSRIPVQRRGLVDAAAAGLNHEIAQAGQEEGEGSAIGTPGAGEIIGNSASFHMQTIAMR